MNKKINPPAKRRSLFFPLLLIAIGLFLLLRNFGAATGGLVTILIQWWPALLILIGLDNLYQREGLVSNIFLIAMGTIFLLANYGIFDVNIWQMILLTWPVLIIAVGFDILIGRRNLWLSLVGVLVVAAILAGVVWYAGGGVVLGPRQGSAEFSQRLDGVTQAAILLEPNAGRLMVDALSGGSYLAAGMIPVNERNEVAQEFRAESVPPQFALTGGERNVYPGSRLEEWTVGLTPAIPLAVDVDMGAGSINLDFTGLQLDHLEVNLGVGEINVTLPASGDFAGKIEGGVGVIRVYVPEGSALRITHDSGLSIFDRPDAYLKSEDAYQSPNYATAENQIDLELAVGVGAVVVIEP
ncbi:MAG: cell wall-active antibiotics response protein [Chloroflexi bacterium]|nr:cell wall-active antibiotics response protein [Chloroflexota bacterium]